jgi:crotonobetainyl-CoA:carnitine CoA-transferase CaiB-like acyl-CoA transferase
VYGVFPAVDGYLVIAAQVDDAWKRLAKLIGGDQLANDTRFHGSANRNANREEALRLVTKWTMDQPSAKACIATLDAAEVPCAPVQRIDEVLADPQIHARGMIIEQDHPKLGRVRLSGMPFQFTGLTKVSLSLAPELGEHNRSIALSLGYSDVEIDGLEQDGVLFARPTRTPAPAEA